MAGHHGFRQSMDWLHTWAGVVLGCLLLAIFWMGSLSVFDREIDRWMQPGTRLPAPPAGVSLDEQVVPHAQRLAADASVWTITLPTARQPALQLDYQDASGKARRHIDPYTGRLIDEQGSLAGTGFIFPFHFGLHLGWRSLGYWLVGLAGMGMLVLLVSGVVAHRKLFREFFTFRPRKAFQRGLLDLHNLSGVLVLPFHFIITLSGLVIFFAIYFQSVIQTLYPDGAARFQQDTFGTYSRPAEGRPAPLASLDAMVQAAEREWRASGTPGRAYMLRIRHPGDAQAHVEVRRSHAEAVTMNVDRLTFDGVSGELLHRHVTTPVVAIQRFLAGLHFIQFEHWALRWLYFLAGLAGCLLIASGLLFWVGARRARHDRHGLSGARLVEGLAITGSNGLVVATLAFFLSNRLLPADASLAATGRAALEVWAFFLAWLGCGLHAALRGRQAWFAQTVAIAVLALAAVLLNWLTTGHHLLYSLGAKQWAIAGMDALLLVLSMLSTVIAVRVRQKALPAQPAGRKACPHA